MIQERRRRYEGPKNCDIECVGPSIGDHGDHIFQYVSLFAYISTSEFPGAPELS